MKLDIQDKKILNILQSNAKLSTKEVAERIGLTVTPTYERIKRLEKLGVISNYTIVLNKKLVGKTLEGFCNITLKEHAKKNINGFERAVIKLAEVKECYHVAGNFDYLIKVIVDDMEEYENFIKNKLASIDNIANVQSSFIMTTLKNNVALDV